MAAAPTPAVIIVGRAIVGFGVGSASMTAPLYISEASPTSVRGALVSFNGLMITGGQLLAYCINLSLTNVHGNWRWMLGVAGLPALFQLVLMFLLPESPRWLYRKGKEEEAISILNKIYTPEKVETEIQALKSSVEAETAIIGSTEEANLFSKLKDAWITPIVQKGLAAGIGVQVFQQFVGINTVMYYSPTIIQFAGIVSNRGAIALSLITSGLNALSSILSMGFVDKYGRKKLMLISLFGIILCLSGLTVMFNLSDHHAPKVDGFQTACFGNNTCPVYLKNPSAPWNCRSCIDVSSGNCGFCCNSAYLQQPGVCLSINSNSEGVCHNMGGKSAFYTEGCPSKFGISTIVLLSLYIISYSPGMGTAPWIVNQRYTRYDIGASVVGWQQWLIGSLM